MYIKDINQPDDDWEKIKLRVVSGFAAVCLLLDVVRVPRSNNTARKRPYTVVSGLKTVTVYGSPYYDYITV
jgi:hypothetical protein